MTAIDVAPHPLLYLATVTVQLPRPLAEMPSPAGRSPPVAAPDDALRAAVRDLLRHGGFKPTGRSKPSSEYLRRAAVEGALAPINLLVDAGNTVSVHSGIPISVVDLDRARPPLRVAVAAPGERFVFNASGQEIDVGGLLCLHDGDGPCANAVKDAQRTKTDGATRRALYLLWGCTAAAAAVDAARASLCSDLAAAGVAVA